MKKIALGIIVAICLLMTLPAVCLGGTKWQALKTEAFTVFYPSGMEETAREILQTLEFYRPEVEKLTGNRRTHLPVVIDDLGLYTNGLANSAYNYIHLFWYPPAAGLLGTVEDWPALAAIHEYTHILQMSNVGKGMKVICSIFGNFYSPNVWLPNWMLEGITVYSESRLFNYQGRLNDGEYDAYIGARVAANRFPSLVEASFEPYAFPLDGSYNYGGVFLDYLAQTYGEEKLTAFFTVHGSADDSMDKSAKKVFGQTFPALWEDWQAYERERFKDFRIDGERVTTDGWYVSHPVVAMDGEGETRLYYERTKTVKSGPDQIYSWAEIVTRHPSTGEEKVVVATTSSFNLSLKIRGQKLYYGVAETKAGYDNAYYSGYGYYAQLREKDLASGEDRLVLAGDLRAYELLPDGSILYAVALQTGFGSKLYLYTPGVGSEFLVEVPCLIDEMAAAGERIVFSARENGKNNDLYLFTLATGELTPMVTTAYGEYGIALAGERLFFHANYDQIYGIYCYDLTTGQVYKMTDGNYAKEPAYDESRGDLYFVGLHADGFDLYRKKATFSLYQLPTTAPEKGLRTPAEEKEIKIEGGGYGDNLSTLTPKLLIPVFTRKDYDSYLAGLYLIGSDAIGHVPGYQVGFLYDIQDQRLGIDSLVNLNFFPPFQAYLGYQSFADRPFYLGASYPLYYRTSPGLSGIDVGLACSYGEDYGTELVPYTAFRFTYPRTRLNFQLEMPVEDLAYAGREKRIGYYAGVEARQLLGEGELTLKAQGIVDPDNQDDVFPVLRGYRKELSAKKGATFMLEYSAPLLRVRAGSWPSFYLEDLYSTLFVEAAVPETGAYQLAYGLEVYQELHLIAGMNMVLYPGVSIGFNRDGKGYVSFLLKGE